jgi:hypothetical protein
MNLLICTYVTLPILFIIFAIFSLTAKFILRSNGYKINFLITQFFYETKILKKICAEKKSLKPLLFGYYIINILLLADLVLLFVLIIIRIPR